MAARAAASAIHNRRPERGYLLVVANQQAVADLYRMVSRLSLYCRKPCNFSDLFEGRLLILQSSVWSDSR